ncbi:glycosyltransferase family 4 protein [Geminocystis herdmanii]|uniref:glycosyltransferase family 4 protein n=1 Tax=Geminocystis herdmanii TaxID=669359 RepID=UPI000348ECEF|nr:glycosyltransferase family 4 protein [Geminocystis herdmanii]
MNKPVFLNLKSKKIIAILFTNYGPYHLARVKAFQSFIANEWNVIGLEISRDGIDYQWKTNLENSELEIYTILDHLKPTEVDTKTNIKKTFDSISKINPDIVVIAGYARLSMLSALCWSLWHRKPAIVLSESKEDDEPRIWWKEIIKSWLVKKYSSALVGGHPHKRYLVKLGFPENGIFNGYDVVDNSVFHPDQITPLNSPLNQPFFLAINRFVEKKNLPLLISAYASYQQQLGENAWHLVLCGDGELRSSLESLIDEYNLSDFVHLPGFLQQDELLPYFAHGKCFIHASTTEQWGLVVNEAMAAGLPVIVSNRCGCFEDLVMEGVNGFGFNPENQTELTNLMIKMSSGEVDLEFMGKASLKHIEKYSPDYFAQGLKSAIEFATRKK